MKENLKVFFIVVGGIIGFIVVLFFLTNVDLKFKEYFSPKYKNVERKVFEQTQSYNHGKTQDLAKYYEEYTKSESIDEKRAIESIIKMNFADFDETNIRNTKLKTFLINVRGY